MISPSLAASLVRMPLSSIGREYPNKLDHVLMGPEDALGPRALHPAFYGSFDWHSAVHCHWALIRLLKECLVPNEAEVRCALAENLTKANLLAEAAYLDRPQAAGFERPYGWTWLLKLALELKTWNDPQGQEWSDWLEPVTSRLVQRYIEFLPKLTYPVRVGTHGNTAFGLVFALEYAGADSQLGQSIIDRALHFYQEDLNAPISTEPSGADFLSPALIEALLMSRILKSNDFAEWFAAFIPELKFEPAIVSDRSDGQIAHLDGLNLSRAWCLRELAKTLNGRSDLSALADLHLQTALANFDSGHYEGEHWLGSFALLALTE